MGAGAKLKKLLAKEDCLALPGCYDGISAKIIENMGFKGAYITGYGIEASRLGKPDLGLASMTEVVDHAKNIVDSIKVPTICDSDTGYGDVKNVVRTVKEFARSGIGGIHLEDQSLPKRCGGMSGRKLVSPEEMVGKIKAAKAVLQEEEMDMLIIGRSDARQDFGVDEVKSRMNKYLEAGADLVMIAEKYTIEDLESVASEFRGKLVAIGGNPGWEETYLSIPEYAKMGVKIVIYPLTGLYAAAKAVSQIYKPLLDRNHITEEELNNACLGFDEVNSILGLEEWIALEDKYKPS